MINRSAPPLISCQKFENPGNWTQHNNLEARKTLQILALTLQEPEGQKKPLQKLCGMVRKHHFQK
jgi:hypothetical protein